MITCPRCDKTSHHPKDVAEGYCGNCHDWTSEKWWVREGYLAGRPLEGDLWLVVAEMIFTWRVMVCDPGSVYDFACYSSPAEALAAFVSWNGIGVPPGEWTRFERKGSRQPTPSPSALGALAASSADCGCKVTIENDELHVWPCSAEHEPVLTRVAGEVAAKVGMEFEIREDS